MEMVSCDDFFLFPSRQSQFVDRMDGGRARAGPGGQSSSSLIEQDVVVVVVVVLIKAI